MNFYGTRARCTRARYSQGMPDAAIYIQCGSILSCAKPCLLDEDTMKEKEASCTILQRQGLKNKPTNNAITLYKGTSIDAVER